MNPNVPDNAPIIATRIAYNTVREAFTLMA